MVISFVVPENKDKLNDKKISFSVSSESNKSNEIIITNEIFSNDSQTTIVIGDKSYNTTITAQNEFGIPITNEQQISMLNIEIKDLPQGEYTMELKGSGYKSYTTNQIHIKDYSQKIIIYTNDMCH